MTQTSRPRPLVPEVFVPATRLVVGVGDAPGPTGPIAWVAQQAAARHLPVLVIHAWHRPRRTSAASPGLSYDAPAAAAGAMTLDLLRTAGVTATSETLDGGSAEALLSVLRPSDEVVVGLRAGHALRRALGDNTVHTLLRRAPCPVAVIPDAWSPPPETGRV